MTEENNPFEGATADDFTVGNSAPENVEQPQEEVQQEAQHVEDAPAPLEEVAADDSGYQTIEEFIQSETDGAFESWDDLVEAYNEIVDQMDSQDNDVEELDEFMTGALEYYRETGDLSKYAEIKSVNYDEMSDTDLMRRALRSQYSDVSEKNFERLFQREVVDKYKLDADRYDSDEVELGQELLKTEANKLRDTFKEEQSRFVPPQRQEQRDAEAAQEQWTQIVGESASTSNLFDNKEIVVDWDGEQFSYEVDDPEFLAQTAVDSRNFFQIFQDESGQVDLDHWYRVVQYAMEPQTFERALINFGRSMGSESVVNELKNPSTSAPNTSAGSGMSEGALGLLKAFAERGRK